MLQINSLTLTHLRDHKELVTHLNLTIHKGDKVAIIGDEGNGKSSLLKIIVDEFLVKEYIDYDGEIIRNYSNYAYLPQHFPIVKQEQTLNDYFFADFDNNLDYAQLYRYAQELSFDSERFTSQQRIATLSGGEKLKIQLLKKLACPFEILFLDEPSNDLDVATLIWLEEFIQQTSKTVLFVSHDEQLLTHVATKIVHLEHVKKRQIARTTVKQSAYEGYLTDRKQTFEHQLQQAKKDREEYAKTIEKHHRIKQSVEQTLRNTKDSTAGRLLAKKMKSVLAQGRRFEKKKTSLTEFPTQEDEIRLSFSDIQPLPASKLLLQLEDFQIMVEQKNLTQPISLAVYGQEKIGIIGDNGIGKSSLLKAILKVLQDREHLSVGYMPQEYTDFLPLQEKPLSFLSTSRNTAELEKIRTHLASLQFTRQEIQHTIEALSGGQKAKLLLLKMVLDHSNVLLLDEPTRNVSPTSQPHLRRMFSAYSGAIITVSHDRLFLKEVCDKVYHLTTTGLKEIDKDSL